MNKVFDKIREEDFNKVIIIFGIIYLFFISRRGGDTRYIFSIILMLLSIFRYITFKYNNLKNYKKEIIFGIIYISLLSISYILSEKEVSNSLSTFLIMTLYSIIFLILGLNLKINKKYYKYILFVLIVFSLGSIFNGIKDVYENYKILSWYRIEGGIYTTVYALELGIYVLLGIFSFFCYKKLYQRFFSLMYILINLYLISCTKSRNDMIMLPLCLGILGIIKYKKKGITIFIGAIILILFSLKLSSEIPQFKRLVSLSKIENIKKDVRLKIFKQGIEVGKNNLVKGLGLGKKKIIVLENHPTQSHFHNNFIETFATQGVFVLISYILFLGMLFIRMVKNYYNEKDFSIKNIKLFGIGILIFSILYGMAEVTFYMKKAYQLIFTIILLSLLVDNSNTKILTDKEKNDEKNFNI